MSFTYIGTKISATHKTSSTSMQDVPSSAIAVGRVAIAAFSTDSISGTGESTDHTITDDQGNSWTLIGEMTQTTDVTTSIWYSVITTEIGTGDNIIGTIASAVIAKNLLVDEFSIGGSGVTVEDYGVGQAADANPEAAVSGLNSGTEHLLAFAAGAEWASAFSATDADYTNGNGTTTIGGSGHENICSQFDYRIASGLTADTCTATLADIRNWCAVLGALSEVGGSSVMPILIQHNE